MRIIYQPHTEPIITPAPPEASWHQPYSEPQRSKGNQFTKIAAGFAIALIASGPIFVNPEPRLPDELGWRQALSEPIVKAKQGLAASNQQFLAFVDLEPRLQDEFGWREPLSEPVRTNWFRPHQQQTLAYVVPIANPLPTQFAVFFPDFAPKKVFPTSQHQVAAFVEGSPFNEVVTESRWHQPWSEPVRTRRFNAALQSVYTAPTTVVFKEEVTEDRWHQPWSEPVRKKPTVAFQQYFAISEVVTPLIPATVADWVTRLTEPVRFRVFPTHQQQSIAFLDSVVFIGPTGIMRVTELPDIFFGGAIQYNNPASANVSIHESS